MKPEIHSQESAAEERLPLFRALAKMVRGFWWQIPPSPFPLCLPVEQASEFRLKFRAGRADYLLSRNNAAIETTVISRKTNK